MMGTRMVLTRFISLAAVALAASANAADIVLTPAAGAGVSITDATGNTTRLRVAEDGSVTIPGTIFKGASPFIHAFGSNNAFVGISAGNFTMSGNNNSSLGAQTLGSATTGSHNVAIGPHALAANTTGSTNTAVGSFSLVGSTTGLSNTAVGVEALSQNSTGDQNIAIGALAGTNVISGSLNIYVGSAWSADESNTIRIGRSQTQNRVFIGGIRGITTASANAIPVMIDSNGQLGTASSSERVKDDIADMNEASDALMNLRPVTFHYKADQDPAGRTLQYGLIAEEVAQVYPGLVAHAPDGQVETVMVQFLPAMLLNEVQKQRRTIERLERALAAMQQRLGLPQEESK